MKCDVVTVLLSRADPVQAVFELQAVALAGDPHGGLHGARSGQRDWGQHRPARPADGAQHAAARGGGGVHTDPGEDYDDFWFILWLNSHLYKVLCSVFAGVYNEYIIKGAGADIHIMIQNVFMYLDSIFCNVALLSVKV